MHNHANIGTLSWEVSKKYIIFCQKNYPSDIETIQGPPFTFYQRSFLKSFLGTLGAFKKNFMAPFLWMEFNCLKATATSRRQFTFYNSGFCWNHGMKQKFSILSMFLNCHISVSPDLYINHNTNVTFTMYVRHAIKQIYFYIVRLYFISSFYTFSVRKFYCQ